MISGVRLRPLKPHTDERGSLTELLRSDWPEFTGFGQAIVTINLPGVIRGWHWHERQTDVIVVVDGRLLVPLYDGRQDSPTFRTLDEYTLDGSGPAALFIPPGVYHGYRTLGARPATILNFPDRTYDPDDPDEQRAPHDDPAIGYDWQSRI